MKADVIIFVLMAVFGEVPQPEVDKACEEREVALERTLEGWERDIIKTHLANDQMRTATPEERRAMSEICLLLGEPVKNYLADFFSVKGGGYPPFPLRVFRQDDFPLRVEGVPPSSAKENSAKKQVF